jgi:hypothetical protein
MIYNSRAEARCLIVYSIVNKTTTAAYNHPFTFIWRRCERGKDRVYSSLKTERSLLPITPTRVAFPLRTLHYYPTTNVQEV